MAKNNNWLKKTLIFFQIGIITLIIACAGFYGYLYLDNNSVKVTKYSVYSKKINYAFEGYKIMVVSDFHNSPSADRVAAGIIKNNPNLVVMIGDLVSMNDVTFSNAEKLLEQICPLYPVYFISGNHEVWSVNHDEIINMVKSKGAQVIDNEVITITHKYNSLNLIGYKDIIYSDNAMRYNVLEEQLDALFAKVEKKDLMNILLFHRANLFHSLEKYPADLVLSGHTHNGQINLPFIKNFILSKRYGSAEFSKGYYRKGNMQLIISGGLSNNILYEPRVFNTPELVEIELKAIN